MDRSVTGLILALASALLWCVGCILGLAFPRRPTAAFFSNAAAACCAAAGAGYVVPDEKLELLWKTIQALV